jgi:hypothetical protein
MDEILTASEVAELLQIHPRTVYKLARCPDESLAADGVLAAQRFLRWYLHKVARRRRVRCTLKNDNFYYPHSVSLLT